jgi:nitrate reductase (NAD(P)H)
MRSLIGGSIDSENARAMLAEYHIGTLDKASQALLVDSDVALPDNAPPREVFLQHKVWTKAVLSAKASVSPDTKIFTFDLEHPEQAAGLPVGQHLMMRLRDPVTREAILRAYTPISPSSARGKLDVLVKLYRGTPTQIGGRMSQALDSIPLGHFVDFRGPHGRFEYLGRGLCTVSGRARKIRHIAMVCGGSGITPIFSVLRAILADREDPTSCVILDGNRTEADILCKAELDTMLQGNEHRCRIHYVLSQPGPGWTGGRGRIDRDLVAKEVGPCTSMEGEDLVLVCGPKPLEESVLSILTSMAWRKDDIVFF